MSNADKTMQQFFMQVVELYEGGYTNMEIDYKKKSGEAGKIRISLSDASKPTHPPEPKPDSKLHDSVGLRPVDGELREQVANTLYKSLYWESSFTRQAFDVAYADSVQKLVDLFAAHLQAAVRKARIDEQQIHASELAAALAPEPEQILVAPGHSETRLVHYVSEFDGSYCYTELAEGESDLHKLLVAHSYDDGFDEWQQLKQGEA